MSNDFLTTVPTRRCFVCGYTGEVTVSNAGLAAYNSGALAQVAFPELDKAVREQIISGTHPWCWEQAFAFDPDDDEGADYYDDDDEGGPA
jgi:hypothetical protein